MKRTSHDNVSSFFAFFSLTAFEVATFLQQQRKVEVVRAHECECVCDARVYKVVVQTRKLVMLLQLAISTREMAKLFSEKEFSYFTTHIILVKNNHYVGGSLTIYARTRK